jgi:hypothetical protein
VAEPRSNHLGVYQSSVRRCRIHVRGRATFAPRSSFIATNACEVSARAMRATRSASRGRISRRRPRRGSWPAARTTPIFGHALTFEHMKDFAVMAGVDFIRIGTGRQMAALQNELRRNDVAYRLRA